VTGRHGIDAPHMRARCQRLAGAGMVDHVIGGLAVEHRQLFDEVARVLRDAAGAIVGEPGVNSDAHAGKYSARRIIRQRSDWRAHDVL